MRGAHGFVVFAKRRLAFLGQCLPQFFVEAGGFLLLAAVFLRLPVGIDPIKTKTNKLPEIIDESMIKAGTVADEEGGTRFRGRLHGIEIARPAGTYLP